MCFMQQEMTPDCLTPYPSTLVGYVVFQAGPETSLTPSAACTPIIHQQEGLVVLVKAT